MASLERWKWCWCLSFIVFSAAFAANLPKKHEQTIDDSSLPPVTSTCVLLAKAELTPFIKQVKESCGQSATAATPAKIPDEFCKTLGNVVTALCALDSGSVSAEIDIGFFVNISKPDVLLCNRIDSLTSDRHTPLIDAVRSALSLPSNDKGHQRTAACDRICNGTTQILCSFILQATRILSSSHLPLSSTTNTGNPTAPDKYVTAEVTGSLQNNRTPSAAVETAPAISAQASKSNETVSSLVEPGLPDTAKAPGQPSGTGSSSTAAGIAKSSPTTAFVASSTPTKVTEVAGSTKTPVSTTNNTAVPQDGTSSIQISHPAATSLNTSSKTKAGTNGSSTAGLPSSPAGMSSSAAVGESFSEVKNEDDEFKEEEDAPSAPPLNNFDMGTGDDKDPSPDEGDDYDEPEPQKKPDGATGDDINMPPKNVPKKHGTFSMAYPDGSGSGFLPVFFMFVILSISLYFVYHYRNKIMGLLLEGRSERRRRPNTSQYRRLSNKLEDVLPVDAETGAAKRMTNVIY